jgi:two-component system sensor kinase FixL
MTFANDMKTYKNDIIIVDDEIPNLQLLSQLLSDAGYQVRWAREPKLALESAKAQPPSMILLDVRMPEMDGFEVCRRLKQDDRTRDIPIIFISALHDVQDRVRGFEAGGVDFISKPFQALEVLARVKTHMDHRRMQLNLEEIVAERTAELSESEAKYRDLVENSLVGVFTTTPDGRFTFVNEAIVRMYDFDNAEQMLIKGSLSRWQDPKQREQMLAELEQHGRTSNFEAETITHTGRRIHVIFSAKLQADTISGMVMDITERKQAEEQMNQLRSELIHTTRRETMGELSSAIAHELNQPLAAIMSNTQAAQRFLDKNPPMLDKVKLALSSIVRNDRRASEIIRKLRNLLKEDISEFTEINANELLEEVVALSHSSFIIKNVSIKRHLGENMPLVSGDRVQLQQVLINLILNALDSYEDTTKDKRQIVITTRVENDKGVCLSVKDFGCGIEESVLNKLFDPFVTTKKEGMGMGLAINKTIIDAHRGHIWAENNPDGGATFHVVLPFNKKEIA